VAILTQAVLLRAVDTGESDRVVHLLTPHTGRVTAIAKGARRSTRRFPGTLDFFNHLRVQLEPSRKAGAMARLEHARLIHVFSGLRTHPARFALASYLLELLDRLAPEGGAPADLERLFGFALSGLAALDAAAPDRRLRLWLELRALEQLGLCPQLSRCVRCQAALGGGGRVDFHVADGGPLCPHCAPAATGCLPIHRGTLRSLEQVLHFDLDRLGRLALSPVTLAEARSLVSRFQRFHLGLELRSQRFLDGLLGAGDVPAA
jgi:DNA repair protein RecO (recombination protein O)